MKNVVIAGLVIVVVLLVGFIVGSERTDLNVDPARESEENTSTEQTPEDTDVTSLANSGLTSLSAEFFNDNTSVTNLDVSGNSLTGALPAEIRKMSNLVTLNASDNNLTGIPAEIGQLSKLRTADFSNNDISGLPLEIGNLSNLETLDLRGNPNVSQHDLNLIKPNIPNAQVLTD